MKNKSWSVFLLLPVFVGCASRPLPPPPVPTAPAREVVVERHERHESQWAELLYYQQLRQWSAPRLAQERQLLSQQGDDPANRLKLAMLLSPARAPMADLTRAAGLLDSIVKGDDATSRRLQPLAMLLLEQLNERLRLEGVVERQSAQLRESQRRAAELHQKLDRLTDIERMLGPRTRPAQGANR